MVSSLLQNGGELTIDTGPDSGSSVSKGSGELRAPKQVIRERIKFTVGEVGSVMSKCLGSKALF